MGRTLVAGIGNIFQSDDGFGVEVVRRLATAPVGDGVDVVDFGIRGVHLAYEIAGETYDTVVLVDAAALGQPPGTLFALEPHIDDAPLDAADAHQLTPAAVLAWIRRIGGSRSRILVVGCEPACVDEGMGLSAPVEAAVDRAVAMVRDIVALPQEV